MHIDKLLEKSVKKSQERRSRANRKETAEPWADREGCDPAFYGGKQRINEGSREDISSTSRTPSLCRRSSWRTSTVTRQRGARSSLLRGRLAPARRHRHPERPGTQLAAPPGRGRRCDPGENLTPALCDPRRSFWPFSKLFLLDMWKSSENGTCWFPGSQLDTVRQSKLSS